MQSDQDDHALVVGALRCGAAACDRHGFAVRGDPPYVGKDHLSAFHAGTRNGVSIHAFERDHLYTGRVAPGGRGDHLARGSRKRAIERKVACGALPIRGQDGRLEALAA